MIRIDIREMLKKMKYCQGSTTSELYRVFGCDDRNDKCKLSSKLATLRKQGYLVSHKCGKNSLWYLSESLSANDVKQMEEHEKQDILEKIVKTYILTGKVIPEGDING